MSYLPRLKIKYREEIIAALVSKFGYTSVMQVPKLQKICINQGVGAGTEDKKQLETAVEEMSLIAGQGAVRTYAKKDISNFKLRKGMQIGARVTLRGDVMYEFLDRLTAVVMPRTRDFRGISRKSFDGRGNYTLGIKEQIVFPEIDIDNITKISGMDITLVTSTDSDEEAYALLKELGMPFRN